MYIIYSKGLVTSQRLHTERDRDGDRKSHLHLGTKFIWQEDESSHPNDREYDVKHRQWEETKGSNELRTYIHTHAKNTGTIRLKSDNRPCFTEISLHKYNGT